MDKYQTQWRIDHGLPPPVLPQWFVDMNAAELLSDVELAQRLCECGPYWSRVGETHMRCLGHLDRSFRKALKRGLVSPFADQPR